MADFEPPGKTVIPTMLALLKARGATLAEKTLSSATVTYSWMPPRDARDVFTRGATYTMHLVVPTEIFVEWDDNRWVPEQIESAFGDAFRPGQKVQRKVTIAVQHVDPDPRPTVVPSDADRLWGSGNVRVFISHVHTHKVQASALKKLLADQWGVSAFVAHEDIEPTKEWLDEIRLGLRSMTALVALITEDFRDSKWCYQEVGFALGRNVPVVPVNCGADPVGLVGYLQAVPRKDHPSQIADLVMQALWRGKDARTAAHKYLIGQLGQSTSYKRSIEITGRMEAIDGWTKEDAEELLTVWKANNQVSQCGAIRPWLTGVFSKHGITP